jgi:hypothetical protein
VIADHSENIQETLRELETPTPRQVRLKSFKDAKMVWINHFGMILVLFLIFLNYFYWSIIPILAGLYGTSAQAVVVKRWDYHGSVYLRMRVEYFVDGKREEGYIVVNNNGEMGQKVNIHYLPLFPGMPSLDESPQTLKRIFAIGFVLFFIFSIFLFKNKVTKIRDFLVSGNAVLGNAGKKVFGSRKIQYEFNGKVCQMTMPSGYYPKLLENDNRVLVLVDPKNPQKAVLYEPSKSLWVPNKG